VAFAIQASGLANCHWQFSPSSPAWKAGIINVIPHPHIDEDQHIISDYLCYNGIN
jgi:hypothetical protein